ncbi:MAG: hypothetical protein ABI386_02980 [Rhodanobacter sp.]
MTRSFLLLTTMIAAVGIGSASVAWSAQTNSPDQPASSQSSRTPAKADRPVIKPGDRACLQHTGSLIPPKPGRCMPVVGSSYSGEELRRTGAQDNARALQMLDPSIRVGH